VIGGEDMKRNYHDRDTNVSSSARPCGRARTHPPTASSPAGGAKMPENEDVFALGPDCSA